MTPKASTAPVDIAGDTVQSVGTALDVLGCLADSPELGVTELARRLGVAKSTAHRLLATLCAKGLVEHCPDSAKYRLGQRLHELGEVVASRSRLRELSLPLLEGLRERTGQTVHLAVPWAGQVFYVERLESYRGAYFSSRVGRRMPSHCTSSGKAIAAFNPEHAAAACRLGFPRVTGRTIRDKATFLQCLQETRRRGYAYSVEEGSLGLSSIAAPIVDHEGTARAAISVAGPTAQIIGDDVGRVARLVLEAAARLGRQEVTWWNGVGYR